MDANRQKYVELSLAGKWIKLAREIIIDNPGMSKSQFIEFAAPLMPTHIHLRAKGRKAGQVELAKDSIYVLTVTKKCVRVIDDKLFDKPADLDAHPKGITGEIVSFAKENPTVSRSDLPHVKHFGKLCSDLCKRKILRRLSPGVFAIAEVAQ